MPEQMSINNILGFDATGKEDKYQSFVDKFKAAKTTDDCYTPENVYDAVADWVASEYDLDRGDFVRPFWPGGDYENFDYPPGCVVVDNPPFSLSAKIYAFYCRAGIKFFLFAPTLTMFAGSNKLDLTYIPCGTQITYANGAKVNTSFVTNLDTCRIRSAPALYRAVDDADEVNQRAQTKQLPKYSYPDHVLTSAAAYRYSQYGVDYRLEKGDCVFIRTMDAQREVGKGCFGGAYLLSDRAAAERAAAERAAAERAVIERQNAIQWTLSDRERAIIAKLGGAQ